VFDLIIAPFNWLTSMMMSAVKHIAIARFKPATSEQQISDFFEAVGRMREHVPGILDYSWGVNDSPEGLSQGFTHALVMTFRDAAAREACLRHPAHEQAKAGILPFVEAVVVVDYPA
jgi:hypothetical protein